MHYHLFVFADSNDEDLAPELRRLHIVVPHEILIRRELSLLT